jgi:hypothetical protein
MHFPRSPLQAGFSIKTFFFYLKVVYFCFYYYLRVSSDKFISERNILQFLLSNYSHSYKQYTQLISRARIPLQSNKHDIAFIVANCCISGAGMKQTAGRSVGANEQY